MVYSSRPSPQGTPAALPYPRLSCLSSTSESRAAPRSTVLQAALVGGSALGAPHAPEARRGGRRGPLGRVRPAGWRQKVVCIAYPRSGACSGVFPNVWAVAGDMTGKEKQTAVKEGLSHS